MTTGGYERELCGRVAPALRRESPDIEVGIFARMPGGHSGLTYRVETTAGPLVVKSVPPGQQALVEEEQPGQGCPEQDHEQAGAGILEHGHGRHCEHAW